MSNIKIKEVVSKRDLTRFIDLPWSLYRSYPHWIPVPKLIQKKKFHSNHPFYKTADMAKWIAIRKGEVVGRIAAIVNDVHNKVHSEKKGFFGFFESVNDKSVAFHLLRTAEEWLMQKGMDAILGPYNPSINYDSGLLVEGFDYFPHIMMTYNPPYYADLLEFQGFSKAKDFYVYNVVFPFDYPDVIKEAAARATQKSDIVVRRLNKRRWKDEISAIRDVYNESWQENWGNVPMSEEEFEYMANQMKPIVDERLIIILESKGRMIGFMMVLPNFNQVFKKIPSGHLFPFGFFHLLRAKKYLNQVRVVAMGVRAEYRKMGLDAMLYLKALAGGNEIGGLKEAEIGWVLEDNFKMNAIIEKTSATRQKVYRIYEKALNV